MTKPPAARKRGKAKTKSGTAGAKLRGGCHCGALRYRVSARPSDSGYCHCGICRLTTGAPAFSDALAVFDCRIAQGMPFGSHDILIGVIAESVVRDGQPLVYSNRSYGKVTSFSTGVAA